MPRLCRGVHFWGILLDFSAVTCSAIAATAVTSVMAAIPNLFIFSLMFLKPERLNGGEPAIGHQVILLVEGVVVVVGVLSRSHG